MSDFLHALPPWNVWVAFGLVASVWVAIFTSTREPLSEDDAKRLPGDW